MKRLSPTLFVALFIPATLTASLFLYDKTVKDAARNNPADAGAIMYAGVADAPPTVEITAPTNGESITAGASYTVIATATKGKGVISFVNIYDGDTLLVQDTAAPYSRALSFTAGTHSLWALVVDSLAASNTSSLVTITATNLRPAVTLTYPIDGTNITAGVPAVLFALTTKGTGTITNVAFYDNGTLTYQRKTTPYSNSLTFDAGLHTIQAFVYDNLGETNASAVATITATNAQPMVFLTAPSNGDYFAAGFSLNVTATVIKGSGTIDSVTFYDGENVIGQDTSAPYSRSVSFVAGTHTLKAVVLDSLGSSSTSSNITVTATNSPPKVSLTAPLTGESYSVLTPVTLTATVTKGTGAISNVAFLEGTDIIYQRKTAPYTTTLPFPAGTHTLRAFAADALGESNLSTPVTFYVTNIPPAVTITSPASGSILAAGDQIFFTSVVTPGTGVSNSVSLFDGPTLLGVVTAPPYTNAFTFLAGNHTIYARTTDSLGETGTSGNTTLLVTNKTFSVLLTTPTNGEEFFEGLPYPLSTKVSSSFAVTNVTFYTNAGALGSVSNSPFLFSNIFPPGHYSVSAKAWDTSGAVTESAPATVSVIIRSPSIVITSPSNGDIFAPGEIIPLSVSVTPGTAPMDCVFWTTGVGNNSPIELYEDLGGGNNVWFPYNARLKYDEAGTYIIYACANDEIGELGWSEPVTFRVGSVNPLVSLSVPGVPSGSTVFGDLGVPVIVQATKANRPIVSVRLIDHQFPPQWQTENIQWILNVYDPVIVTNSLSNTFLFDEGTHLLQAIATDSDGKSATNEFVFDSAESVPTNPVVITSPATGTTFKYKVDLTVTVSATVPRGDTEIETVELWSLAGGGTRLATSTSTATPFGFKVRLPAGLHELFAVSIDSHGIRRYSRTTTKVTGVL